MIPNYPRDDLILTYSSPYKWLELDWIHFVGIPIFYLGLVAAVPTYLSATLGFALPYALMVRFRTQNCRDVAVFQEPRRRSLF